MGVSQIQSSFQNDGNFSQLDLQDVQTQRPIMRIETFRASQPEGEFGTTRAGTSVKALAGKDHLTETSNRTFRHIFSSGLADSVVALLEIRETFDEDGTNAVLVRDVDGRSESFGYTLSTVVKPTASGLDVTYKVIASNASPAVIKSPIKKPLTDQVQSLVDLADLVHSTTAQHEVSFSLDARGNNVDALKHLSDFASLVQQEHPQWTRNVQLYERMGDFRDKCIHDGTNLTGSHPRLASEFLLIRPYRVSLIMLGRAFDPAMSEGANQTPTTKPLAVDTKPGVYTVFLSAYAMNIGLYQLGIDKVHSDYGGIPMKLKPGSRLENGAEPIVDATNLNRVLAILSAIYYAPDALQSIVQTKPRINAFGQRQALAFFANESA